MIVPPLGEFALNSPGVPNLDASNELKGKFEIEIAYGPSRDNLKYLLTYELYPSLVVHKVTESAAQFTFAGPLRKHQHKRA
ncbi:MAG: hypothetical protein ACKVP4_04575 [Hyphomicrobium sp.]